MTALIAEAATGTACATCGAPLKQEAAFCTRCGQPVAGEPVTDTVAPLARHFSASTFALALLGLIVALLAAALVVEHLRLTNERSDRGADARTLTGQLRSLNSEVGRLSSAQATLSAKLATSQKEAEAGFAPLAARTLRSVFTIETYEGTGTGWAAWQTNKGTFLITANHVVDGVTNVTVRNKGRSWKGTVVKTDSVNDLALIRVPKLTAKPLWPNGSIQPTPNPGDELVLVGSPYGLEGTVTTGIVSRVTYNRIQTDAAANPGNSGGPAVDGDGNVVGILVAGGGENLNFAIPIQRACVTIRDCSGR